MPKISRSRLLWQLAGVCCVVLICLGLQSPPRTTSASMTGTTWFVTSASDNVNDTGSLRFALAHASSGDLVSFTLNTENTIVAGSTLTVPAGVAVGRTRNEACGDVNSPLANIKANDNPYISPRVNPVISLSANSTLRNVDVGGGYNGVKITGANVDVCGVGLGLQSGGDSSNLPPYRAALIVNGDHAVIHRNIVNAFMVVDIHGSDSRIGDTLDGSGDSNQGGDWCGNRWYQCTVTVFADSTSAAQRVTIRDPFPRGLAYMPGNGILGGDDVITHSNNWAGTPNIISAYTYDSFATVVVTGTANPLSLVDIYFDNYISLTRQIPVMANAAGIFNFTGPLPGSGIWVRAVSTLDDPAHPNRVGSSSQFSEPVQVIEGTSTVLQLEPPALTFWALAGEANPPAQHLAVTAPTISPTLAWQTSVTTNGGPNWLAALPASSSGHGVLTVTVNATGLAQGVYHGAVTVSELGQPADQATTDVALFVVTRRVWLPLIIR